jgi:DNA excision repair protein ERCC-4
MIRIDVVLGCRFPNIRRQDSSARRAGVRTPGFGDPRQVVSDGARSSLRCIPTRDSRGFLVGLGAMNGGIDDTGGDEVDPEDGRVRIVADDRERAGGVVALLEARPDVECVVKRLAVGDYRVEERVLVERKTLADFALSLVDGRLFSQATKLVHQPGRAVLILEGTGADLARTGVSREALHGALITISVFHGIAVLRSTDAEETARLLVYLGRQVWRFARGGLPRPGYRPKGKRARQLFLLQGLPGVGPGRAARLLERFGSVEAVMAAPAEKLAEVDGLGEKTAARIRWAVEEAGAMFGGSADTERGASEL